MPRKGPAPRRDLVSDPIYHSVARDPARQQGDAARQAQPRRAHRLRGDGASWPPSPATTPWRLVKRAVDNVKPPLEVKSRRVGGATYQVPVEVRPRRSTTLAIRWIVDFARARREKTMAECLAAELTDAANGLGAAVKKRDDMQKMAESNRAYAHYRY